MTDHILLILVAVIVGCLSELSWLAYRVAFRKEELVENPVYLITAHCTVASLIVYVILYIAYRLFFNAYP